MRLRRVIKHNALHALRRHWSRAAAIALILMILSQLIVSLELLLFTVFHLPDFADPFFTPDIFLDNLPNAAPAAVAILGLTVLLRLLLVVPLMLGTKRWYYRTGDGRAEETLAIFAYFSSLRLFLRSIGLSVLTVACSAIWSVVFLAPPFAVLYFAGLAARQAGTDLHVLLATGLTGAGFVLLALMSVFLVIHLMRYYLAPFALAESPEESAMNALRHSVQASRGQRGALLVFELSMLGWRLLEFLFIPMLFTYPYRSTAQGLYAHYLFERRRRAEAERQNNEGASSAAAGDASQQGES